MGNSNFCKIADGNHEEATGIPAFLSPEIAGIFTCGEKTLLRGHIVLISEERDVKMIMKYQNRALDRTVTTTTKRLLYF